MLSFDLLTIFTVKCDDSDILGLPLEKRVLLFA